MPDISQRVEQAKNKLADAVVQCRVAEQEKARLEQELRELGVDPPTVEQARKVQAEFQEQLAEAETTLEELLEKAGELVG